MTDLTEGVSLEVFLRSGDRVVTEHGMHGGKPFVATPRKEPQGGTA